MSPRAPSPIESAFDHGLREPHDPRHHHVDVRHLKKEHVDKAIQKMVTVIPALKPDEFFLREALSSGRPLTGDHQLAPLAKTLPFDEKTILDLFTPTAEELQAAGVTPLVYDPDAALAEDTYDLKCIIAIGAVIAQVLALAATAIGVFLQIRPVASALVEALKKLPANLFARIQELLRLIKDGVERSTNLQLLIVLLWETKLLGTAFVEWANGLPWWRVAFDLAVALANVSLWFLSGGAYIAVAIACVLAGIVQLVEMILDAINACKGASTSGPTPALA